MATEVQVQEQILQVVSTGALESCNGRTSGPGVWRQGTGHMQRYQVHREDIRHRHIEEYGRQAKPQPLRTGAWLFSHRRPRSTRRLLRPPKAHRTTAQGPHDRISSGWISVPCKGARGERCGQSQVRKGGRRTRVPTDTGKQEGDWCCSTARRWYLYRYAWHQYIATTAALCPLALLPPLLPVVRTTHSVACALASCHLSPEFCRVERGFAVVA